MCKSFIRALGALLIAFLTFPVVANAGVEGPDPYDGRPFSEHCEAPTHLSYYDPRNEGQTAFETANGQGYNGDNVYYVDTDPLAGFDSNPDLAYQSTQTADEDCKGTPVLRTTAYGAVTFIGGEPEDDQHIGFPSCPRNEGDDLNPYCEDDHTGVRAAFYVGTADGSTEFGRKGGVTVP